MKYVNSYSLSLSLSLSLAKSFICFTELNLEMFLFHTRILQIQETTLNNSPSGTFPSETRTVKNCKAFFKLNNSRIIHRWGILI